MKRNWKAGYKKRQKRRTEEKGTETTGEHEQLKYTRLPVNFSSRVDIASHERGAIASDGHPRAGAVDDVVAAAKGCAELAQRVGDELRCVYTRRACCRGELVQEGHGFAAQAAEGLCDQRDKAVSPRVLRGVLADFVPLASLRGRTGRLRCAGNVGGAGRVDNRDVCYHHAAVDGDKEVPS